MTTAAASPLESLPLEILLKIFALNFTNPDDDFTNLTRLWEQRRTSKIVCKCIEATFQDNLLHVTIEKSHCQFKFHTCAENETETTIAVFTDTGRAKWSESESIRLSEIFPGWAGMIHNRTHRPDGYEVKLWEKKVRVALPSFCILLGRYTFLLVDWVHLYNRFFAEEIERRRCERLKEMEKECFLDIAYLFGKGKITFEASLDYHLVHLSGTRHKADRYIPDSEYAWNTASDLTCILKSDLVAGAFKNCIEEPNFNLIKNLQPLKILLMSAWNNDLIAIQEATSQQDSISYFQLPLLEVFVATAFVKSHLDLLSYLLSLTSPPSTSIFDKIYSTDRETFGVRSIPLDDAAAWLIIQDAGWMHPPFPVHKLIHHAIRSRDNYSAISLLQRLDAISYKYFPVTSLCQHATLEVAKWVISQRLASGEKLIPEAINAAAIRTVDGPALIEFLLDSESDVNAKSFSLDRNDRDVWMLGDKAGPSGETALMAACRTGTRETVELLLKMGARKDLKDDYQKTALDYANEVGRSDIIELLETSTSLNGGLL